MPKKPPLTIGALAKAVGVNVETIRFYQRKGLIRQPEKPLSGFRVYPPETRQRLAFIRSAKELGFTLNEIAELLKLEDSDCRQARALAEGKLAAVRSRIQRLEQMRDELERLVAACGDHGDGGQSCAIIRTLAADAG